VISDAQLAGVAGWLQEHGAEESNLPALRQHYPDMHFTWCMDDDVCCDHAALESESFSLYLVDGHDHCLKLTNDPDIATGVVIAEVTED
jgi:hypothetical protein